MVAVCLNKILGCCDDDNCTGIIEKFEYNSHGDIMGVFIVLERGSYPFMLCGELEDYIEVEE